MKKFKYLLATLYLAIALPSHSHAQSSPYICASFVASQGLMNGLGAALWREADNALPGLANQRCRRIYKFMIAGVVLASDAATDLTFQRTRICKFDPYANSTTRRQSQQSNGVINLSDNNNTMGWQQHLFMMQHS